MKIDLAPSFGIPAIAEVNSFITYLQINDVGEMKRLVAEKEKEEEEGETSVGFGSSSGVKVCMPPFAVVLCNASLPFQEGDSEQVSDITHLVRKRVRI